MHAASTSSDQPRRGSASVALALLLLVTACGHAASASAPADGATDGAAASPAPLDPLRDRIYEALARGDGEAALAILDAVDPALPPTYALEVDRAVALGLAGQAAQSIQAADRALALVPDRPFAPEAMVAKIEGLLWLGDVKSATRLAEQTVDANPDDPGALHALGHAYLRGVRLDRAEQAFHEALALAPHDYASTLGLLSVLVFSIRHEEAQPLLDALEARHPGDPWIAYHRAGLHLAREDVPAAIASYEEAIARAAPRIMPFAHYHLARTLIAADAPDRARPHLETFLLHAPPFAKSERRFAEQELRTE